MMRLVVFTLLVSCSAMAQQVWFGDGFEANPLEGQWSASSPEWTHHEGIVRIDTRGYDQLLASPWNLTATLPFRITVRLRGDRSGVYFCLDRRDSKALSHMVRFEGTTLLAGYFDGAGVFQATTTATLAADLRTWRELSIAVDPMSGQYRIFVDERPAGDPQTLLFRSGFVGLQASDGLSEFDFIRVSGPPWEGKPPDAILGQVPAFRHVEWVRWAGDEIEVYDPERKAILLLDGGGRLRRVLERPEPGPRTAVEHAGRRFEIVGKTILITDLASGKRDSVAGMLVEPWSLCPGRGLEVYVADVGKRSIIKLGRDGTQLGEFRGAALGGLKAPRGLDVDSSGQLVIADYDRLVFADTTLRERVPEISDRSAGGARIVWPRWGTRESLVRYRPDGGAWNEQKGVLCADGRSFEARLTGLAPLTRYSFTVQPALRTIPEESSVSALERFSTSPADPALLAYTRLPVMCMVYRTFSPRDRYPEDRYPSLPPGRSLADDELRLLENAVQFNEEFTFRNSSCRLALDIDMFVVEDTLWLSDVGSSDPYWLEPGTRVTHDFELAARHFGKEPSDYHGLIVPYAWLNTPTRRRTGGGAHADSISIRQAYGGGTYGVPAPWTYGATSGYTANPFADRFSRQDWLITHEFHHQLDALMDVSGFGDYFHADMPWLMPGRFGEDFDFNAEIMRRAPLERWLTLVLGALESTADADHDGVPDDDPSLPLDEKRLGGSPLLRDTDHDSWQDLEEMMAGTSRGTGFAQRDTDGDGITDGDDSEPLYPFPPSRGRFEESPRWDFGTIRTSSYEARFSLEWDEEDLLLFCETTAPVNLLFQIDAHNDGWFHGFDNVQIRLDARGDSVYVLDYYLRDCSSWVDPPHDRRDILRVEDLQAGLEIDAAAGRRRITLRVPRLEAYGLTLNRDDVLAVRIGTQTTEDRWVWDELFERNAMMTVILE